MDVTVDHLDDPAIPSPSAAPAGGRHLAVLGHYRMGATYSVSRPSGAASWLLTWTIGGHGRLAHGAAAVGAAAGDLVLLGPGVPQRYGTAGRSWAFWWAHFQPRPAWRTVVGRWRVGPELYRVAVADRTAASRISAAFHRALLDVAPGAEPADETIHVSTPATTDLVLNALEEVLLRANGETERRGDDAGEDPIAPALRAISADPAARHSVASLAAATAMSPSHFAHEFKRRTGRTPMDALRDERLGLAATLLRSTSLPVARVAKVVGFTDPYYFSRVFHRHVGVAPSAYSRGASPPSPRASAGGPARRRRVRTSPGRR